MEIVGQEIQIASGQEKMGCYLAHPKTPGRYPAVVVTMEVVGLSDDIRHTSNQFAEQGFVAIAPNLYFRIPGPQTLPYGHLPEALKLAATLTDDGIVRDMSATIDFVKDHPLSNGKVGVVGFCMGGRIAFLTACRNSTLNGAISFYGGGILRAAQPGAAPAIDYLANLRAPMIAFFAGQDPHIPLSDGETIGARAKQLGKQVEVRVYPEAGHGFMCENPARGAYHEASAKDAWPRMLSFFRQHLG
ncbi:MAG TPA: dienelactone hydrolase family protein [Candidatus Binataceae bacterium]|nr:dienelactone hydrolase family protein [Candidatus Binataceae bacterium]